jgi:hypothetical protein
MQWQTVADARAKDRWERRARSKSDTWYLPAAAGVDPKWSLGPPCDFQTLLP